MCVLARSLEDHADWTPFFLLAKDLKTVWGGRGEYSTPSPHSETGQESLFPASHFICLGEQFGVAAPVLMQLKIESGLDWPDCWFRMLPSTGHPLIYASS